MIEVNNKVIVSEPESHKTKYHYTSSVAEILGNNLFLLYVPQAKRVHIRFPAGSEHVFTFYTDAGLHRGTGLILGYVEQNNVTLMKVALQQLEYIQRRNFFRVDILRHFTFSLNTHTDSPENKEMHEGLIKNLSGSGICITTKKELTKNQTILCFLPPDIVTTPVYAKVVSVVQCTDSQTFPDDSFMIRLYFVGLDVQRQDTIVKYVFRVERENILRKKGIIT